MSGIVIICRDTGVEVIKAFKDDVVNSPCQHSNVCLPTVTSIIACVITGFHKLLLTVRNS